MVFEKDGFTVSNTSSKSAKKHNYFYFLCYVTKRSSSLVKSVLSSLRTHDKSETKLAEDSLLCFAQQVQSPVSTITYTSHILSFGSFFTLTFVACVSWLTMNEAYRSSCVLEDTSQRLESNYFNCLSLDYVVSSLRFCLFFFFFFLFVLDDSRPANQLFFHFISRSKSYWKQPGLQLSFFFLLLLHLIANKTIINILWTECSDINYTANVFATLASSSSSFCHWLFHSVRSSSAAAASSFHLSPTQMGTNYFFIFFVRSSPHSACIFV